MMQTCKHYETFLTGLCDMINIGNMTAGNDINNTITISQNDLNQLAELLAKMKQADANPIWGMAFDLLKAKFL